MQWPIGYATIDPFTFSLPNNVKTSMLRVHLCMLVVVALCGRGRGSSAVKKEPSTSKYRNCAPTSDREHLATVFQAMNVIACTTFITPRGAVSQEYIPTRLRLNNYQSGLHFKLGGTLLHPSEGGRRERHIGIPKLVTSSAVDSHTQICP